MSLTLSYLPLLRTADLPSASDDGSSVALSIPTAPTPPSLLCAISRGSGHQVEWHFGSKKFMLIDQGCDLGSMAREVNLFADSSTTIIVLDPIRVKRCLKIQAGNIVFLKGIMVSDGEAIFDVTKIAHLVAFSVIREGIVMSHGTLHERTTSVIAREDLIAEMRAASSAADICKAIRSIEALAYLLFDEVVTLPCALELF